MGTALLKRLMDELAGMGTLFLTFSGGEIFLRKDLGALLDHAHRRAFSLKLITNGTLISPEFAKRLAERPVHEVGISIYSMDPEVHDRMTGVAGSLARSRDAVETLVGLGVRAAVKTLITGDNAAGYPAVRRWARSLGPRARCEFDFTVTPRNDGAWGPAVLNLGREEKRAFIRKNESRPGGNRRRDDLEKSSGRKNSGDMPCYAGSSGAYVNPQGTVFPCIDWRLPCGSLRKQNFLKLWRASKNLAFARRFTLGAMMECAGCRLLTVCSPCPGINQQERGNPALPSGLVCERAFAHSAL
jgi:radical SAM protein with 4Fe4S-binding SPASM domain